jgi:sugar lactone lactonase YvrE
MDADGRLWVGCPGSNQVGIVDDERFTVVVEDHGGTIVREPTNLAFGDPDGHTVIVGSCAGTWLPTFRMP